MDKKYNHIESEQAARDLWEKEKTYQFEEKSKKEIYSVDTPPPTVSGNLHIGHLFSYTHTDIIVRYKRMSGYNVFYPMGFDDNGLPTERYVEKKNKIKGHMLKRSEFIKLCLKESEQAEKTFEQLWKRLALSVDWSKVYSTISDKTRKISQLSFIELFKKNLVYKKAEPSLYCTTCQTSVAQAELDNMELKTVFNEVEFKTQDGQQLIIATTRPELIPACVAVFYHPKDKRYKELEGKFAITPIYNKKIPILPDEQVDPEKGTGIVMCCTFGDVTDIYWRKKHNLPFIQAVGLDGRWTKITGELEGLKVQQARKKILDLLKESGALLKQTQIKHNVNTHERCKQEIEYLILSQWFVKILEYKDDFLKQADKVNWFPKFMKARYQDWVKNLAWDWCISRQRFYGIPFPVWYCQDCGTVITAEEKDLPIDPQEQKYPGEKCPKCKNAKLTPDTDIMDTWNTSALTPHINANWPQKSEIKLPMSLRPQAHDIIRTWAFYTIVKSYFHNKTIPWKDIVISGHVLSSGKEKISKSKGNEKLTPENLLDAYPADAVRFWAASGRLGTDTAFSENQLKIGQRLTTKIWNAFRFCKDHIENYQKPEKRPELDDLNRWLLHKFSFSLKQYRKHFDAYQYSQALEIIDRFFWSIFCDNYLELIKDQLFNPEKYKTEQIENTKFSLYEVGFGILQLYAPFICHVTETLYQNLYKKNETISSIHLTQLDNKRYDYAFAQSKETIDMLIDIIASVRKLKSENKVSLKTEIENLNIYSENQEILGKIGKHEDLIMGITKAKKIDFLEKEKDEVDLKMETKDDKWFVDVTI